MKKDQMTVKTIDESSRATAISYASCISVSLNGCNVLTSDWPVTSISSKGLSLLKGQVAARHHSNYILLLPVTRRSPTCSHLFSTNTGTYNALAACHVWLTSIARQSDRTRLLCQARFGWNIDSNILKFADDTTIFKKVRKSTDCSKLQANLD